MTVLRGWCCCHCWWRWRLALVALGKEPKIVNLLDEVGHAGPSSKPKPNHQNPHHNKCIEHIHCSPAWHKERRLLCSILQNKNQFHSHNWGHYFKYFLNKTTNHVKCNSNTTCRSNCLLLNLFMFYSDINLIIWYIIMNFHISIIPKSFCSNI